MLLITRLWTTVYGIDKEAATSEVFCKKGVHRNLVKFTGKHMCQSLFFNKVAGHKMVKHTQTIRRQIVFATLVFYLVKYKLVLEERLEEDLGDLRYLRFSFSNIAQKNKDSLLVSFSCLKFIKP